MPLQVCANALCWRKIDWAWLKPGYELPDSLSFSQGNRFIVAVGWDRHINTYLDTDTSCHCVRSLPLWRDDAPAKGHHDDIYALAFGAPDYLATGDYIGQIIIWNFLTGRIVCKLNSRAVGDSPSADGDTLLQETPIIYLLFLSARHGDLSDGCASLVSCGRGGFVDLWHVGATGQHWGCFSVPQSHQVSWECPLISISWCHPTEAVHFLQFHSADSQANGNVYFVT